MMNNKQKKSVDKISLSRCWYRFSPGDYCRCTNSKCPIGTLQYSTLMEVNIMEKALLSLKEVCEYTGWKETKVRELLKEKQVHSQ